MSPLEIVLIIAGIIVIIISCRLVDKNGRSDGKNTVIPFSFEENVSEEDKKRLMEKLRERLDDISEEMIIRADDTLGRISNEKIIAVNEFSDQILEKIKRNHEEVVFLYNMLNDKEKEMKAAMKEIDLSKKKVQEIIESKAVIERLQTAKGTKTAELDQTVARSQPKPVQELLRDVQTALETEEPSGGSLNSNHNTQILNLYSQGKSVMEISRLLGMGQGEVKLVIDLFKGRKSITID
ncbi:MAG TPA: hypothetical protein GXX75_08135 [Clostridiales bacterium]|nr:hypothetical protein [Clostridiales bacterium]